MSKDNILRPLVGRDGAKAVLRSALRSGDVHLCLTGPPESGKSVALTAIEEAVPGALYRDSSDITLSKLKDVLADDPPVLLLEEADDMDTEAAKGLSTVLEQGRVTKTNQRVSYDETIDTQVIAACNDFSDLPHHIQTRFADLHFPPYTRDEFLTVCARLLPDVIGWIDHERVARSAAETVADVRGELSVRATKRAATLAGSLDDVETMCRALEDAEADVDSEPITPEEIAANAYGGGPVRKNMADPSDLGDMSADDVLDAMAQAQEDAQAQAATGADETGVEIDASGPAYDWDVPISEEKAEAALVALANLIENGQRAFGNGRDVANVQVIAPTPLANHVESVFSEHKLDPTASWGLASETIFDDDFPDATDEIFAYDFMLAQGESARLKDSGFDLEKIMAALDDLPVVYSKSSLVDAELPV